MSSIIEGYNYDIFISYRQKDNKHDGWVTEFVNQLKGELESTFKEEICVYFDINPHDGLLETHDVDASLKEKLKCVVFIPIISRTYCDPRSFAWEHEFKPFVEEASKDKLGLKIRLSNGNVANRVLPVRIHDLEIEDVKRFEEITGGVMRTLDFVFKTNSGVNRPLKLSEDHPVDNINKTYYQDQINKVALSIREIVHGILAEPIKIGEKENQERIAFKEPAFKEKKTETIKSLVSTKKSLVVTLAIFFTIFIISGVFLFPKLFKQDNFERIRDADGRISIAVMPFENLTGDTTLNWFQRGMSSLLINGLGNSVELLVSEDQTMFEVMEGMKQIYTAGFSPSAAREVARKVNAETYITGSFQGRENTYWILVNLISSETGNILWTNKVEGNLKSPDYLTMSDSLINEIKNYLEIKVLEVNADYDFREAYPKSAEAYKYFIEGMNLVLNQNYDLGIRSLKKALEIDSTFTLASFYITYAYSCQLNGPEMKTWTKKTYLYKDRVPPKYQLWIELWYLCEYGKNIDDITRCCDLLSESGINTRLFWSDIGSTYNDYLRQYDKAVKAFEKVMAICQERGIDWKFIIFWDRFQLALHRAGYHEREKEISNMGLKLFPDNSNWFYYYMAICALSQGNASEADEILIKYMAKHKELGTPETTLEVFLGSMYEEANMMDQAEIHYRQACEIDPQNTDCLMKLAYFLIDRGININEGLDLINKVRVINPKITAYHSEGWALYKLGRYEEAEELIEKAWVRMVGFNIDVYRHLEAAKKAAASQRK